MKAIAHIETPFMEKFGVPRQSLLIEEAWGRIRLPKNDFNVEAVRGLEEFTHLWLIFQFHQVKPEEIKALVRPPRLGGKEKRGVWATRSPHRPNQLGLSVVKFDRMEETAHEVILHLSGLDLVTGTPIFDIKPYIPYSDIVSSAQARSYADKPESFAVLWDCNPDIDPNTKVLIRKVIALDPRPAHQKEDSSIYGVSLAGYNVKFSKKGDAFHILEVI